MRDRLREQAAPAGETERFLVMQRPQTKGGRVADLARLFSGRLLVKPRADKSEWRGVCATESISRALREAVGGSVLLIPLGNSQVIRAASLLAVVAVVVCDGAAVEPEAVVEAKSEGMGLIATTLKLNACQEKLALLPANTAGASQFVDRAAPVEADLKASFPVLGGGYFLAGYASQRIRKLLEAAGVEEEIVRRICIASYEAEMNVCIYAPAGRIDLCVRPEVVEVCVSDNGPGIADLKLAMQPGYSTAPPKARAMGFGAGMGLPNIAGCCDELSITSAQPNGGNKMTMRFVRRMGA